MDSKCKNAVKFNGSCLKQDKATSTPRSLVDYLLPMN